MTLRSSADVGFVLLAGYDIMGLITDLDEKLDQVLEQSDGLGAATDEWTDVGMTKFDLSLDGFYDDTLTRTIEALAGEMVMLYALESNTIGDRCVGVNAIRSTINRGPSRDALTKVQIALKSDEGSDRGQISAPHVARTAIGPAQTATDDWGTQAAAVNIAGSSADNPAVITTAAMHLLVTGDTVLIAGHGNNDLNGNWTVTVLTTTTYTVPVDGGISGPSGAGGTSTRTNSKDGAVGYMECDALTLGGATNVVIEIKDSDDDITFANLIAFAAVTAAPDSERGTAAGNVQRYTQTEHEFVGGAPAGQTITFATGLRRI